jgi:hypothetical protein
VATVSITATAAELLQLGKAIKFSVADKLESRRYSLTINDAPGGNSTWSVTDPQGGVRKG